MNKSKKFSPEVRERAVRMVLEHREEYPSLWTAVESIAPKIGCVPQTLLTWVKQHEVDAGVRDGVCSAGTKGSGSFTHERGRVLGFWLNGSEISYVGLGARFMATLSRHGKVKALGLKSVN